jgi:hypothetical protein
VMPVRESDEVQHTPANPLLKHGQRAHRTHTGCKGNGLRVALSDEGLHPGRVSRQFDVPVQPRLDNDRQIEFVN